MYLSLTKQQHMFNFIKRLKFSYTLYNVFQRKALEHNLAHYRRYGISKNYFSSVSSKDFALLEGEKNIYDRLDSAKELPKAPTFQQLDEKLQAAILNWSQNGYALLEGFYSSHEVDAMNKVVDDLINTKQANWQYGNKIMFAIHQSETLLHAGTNERLMGILNLLLGREAELFQSINFITGSQQRTHSDSIHMTTFPFGNIIAVWIALEDITVDSGPLHYYPGSHTLPYVMNKDFGNESNAWRLGNKTYADYEDKIAEVIAQNDLEKKIFLAKKGDLFIWHANLLHGGEPQLNEKQTRKSMVFHYYAKDVIRYHEITERPCLKRLS